MSSTTMDLATARQLRLVALGLTPTLGGGGRAASALDITRHLGALQAQEYSSGAWSLGARSDLTSGQVEAAVERREIVRTWPMRGTIHWVPAADARWMCELTGLRQLTAVRTRCAQLGITEAMLEHAGRILAEHLTTALSRPEVFALLEDNGMDTSSQRGYHYVSHHCATGLLCQGPLVGKQHSFVLIDSWVPLSHKPTREEAAATIVERYVRSHAPVTEKDVAGWLGHTLGFVRSALAALEGRVKRVEVGGIDHLVHEETLRDLDAAQPPAAESAVLLLPQWDEFLLGYKERSLVLPPERVAEVVPGRNMIFQPTLVIDGVVSGTWKRSLTDTRVAVVVSPFGRLSATERRGVQAAGDRYARFLGRELDLVIERTDR